jgi:hypothetical protein
LKILIKLEKHQTECQPKILNESPPPPKQNWGIQWLCSFKLLNLKVYWYITECNYVYFYINLKISRSEIFGFISFTVLDRYQSYRDTFSKTHVAVIYIPETLVPVHHSTQSHTAEVPNRKTHARETLTAAPFVSSKTVLSEYWNYRRVSLKEWL